MSQLRTLRKAADFTQVELALSANVSRYRLCMAESGYLELRPDEIKALNQTLETGIERTARVTSEFQRASLTTGVKKLS